MFKLIWLIFCTLYAGNLFALQVPASKNHIDIDKKLKTIEEKHHIKVGVYAIDTNSKKIIAYHPDDKFPFQSTCKFIGVSALLAKNKNQGFLNKTVVIKPKDLLFWHPITGKYINHEVSLKILAEGAISYSDNTAINMIFRELGGLDSINNFARSLGNQSFNISHYEINLNSSPDKNDDTSTPKDMANSLQSILLGGVLSEQNKSLLTGWMRNNTTGYNRIRAGVPLGWAVADKTGSGSYGIANDIGIAWSPVCKPVILSIYSIGKKSKDKPKDVVIKEVTQVIFETFSRYDSCYQATKIS